MSSNEHRVRHWEDVEEGEELATLVKSPSEVQLAMYSAVTGIFHRIHYDLPFAQGDGLPGVLVHGPLQGALITQVVTNWMGPTGFLKKVNWNNRGMAVAGDKLICKGKVTRKYVEDGERLVECEVWDENDQGQQLTVGAATVRLPSRTGA